MNLQPRRTGATLVIVAAMMTVVIGVAAIAIDASRLYVMRAELQTTADASAIAGIVEVKDKRPTNAPTAALQYKPLNTVERQVATMDPGNVEGGSWDFTTNTFTPLASWTDPALNAVRVTATYPGSYTFARIFGSAGRIVQAKAIGALGFVGTTDCLRPWAVSYQTVLNVLYPPAGSKDPSYNLTAQDIQTLAGMSYPANSVPLLMGTGNANALDPGNIAEVQVSDPWSGKLSYHAAISGSCGNLPVGPGTWLSGDPAEGNGTTKNPLFDFCSMNGGVTGNPNSFQCNGQPKVKLAMWDESNMLPGGNLMLRVKYVGVFAIVGFAANGTSAQMTGFFTSMASTGGFSANPTPITGSIALVQ